MQWVRHTWDLTRLQVPSAIPSPYDMRPARANESDLVLRLVLDAYASDPIWQPLLAGIAERMTERIDTTIGNTDCAYLIAHRNGEAAAVSGVAEQHRTDQNLLTGICVAPAHQRRGLGTALLAQSLLWLRGRCLREARVYTEAGSLADEKIYRLFGSWREANVQYPGVPQ